MTPALRGVKLKDNLPQADTRRLAQPKNDPGRQNLEEKDEGFQSGGFSLMDRVQPALCWEDSHRSCSRALAAKVLTSERFTDPTSMTCPCTDLPGFCQSRGTERSQPFPARALTQPAAAVFLLEGGQTSRAS